MLAAVILLTAAVSSVSPLLALRSYSAVELRWVAVLHRLVFAFAFTLCLLGCGATLAAGRGGGLFWLPVAYLLAIVLVSGNCWKILVEFRRGIPRQPTRDRKIIGTTLGFRPARSRRGTAAGRDP